MPRAWTVIAARYGTLETTLSDLYYRYESYGEPDGPARMDYFFWVLRRGEETILVDTGFHPDAGKRRGRACLIEPAAAMARLGVGPDTVARLLVTHLHYDHIGNLDVLPDAELIVPGREIDFWLGPLGRRGQFALSSEEDELAYVSAALDADRVRLVRDDDEQVADGVHVVVLGGHTPGQAAVVVQTATGPVVLASDAVHFYEELERDRPFAVFADLANMYTAYDTLRAIAGATGSLLVPGHDPAVMDRHPRVEGPAADFAVRIA